MTTVQDHYGSDGIVSRILAALPEGRGDQLTAPDLYPFDQFHGRELAATKDHAALLAPKPSDRVLDIGAGIGGPARYIALTFGCEVIGIDLTPHFVEAATDLTNLAGLSGRVRFVQGDAAALPFEAATFDRACCLYVGMNLPDVAAVLAEAARVLRPGGRLVWSQVTTGQGDPPYPLPWARVPEASHLISAKVLKAAITAAGFDVDRIEDETAIILDHAGAMKAAGRVPSAEHVLANQVVMGDDFMDRRRNFIAGMGNGSLRGQVAVAHRV